MKRLANYIILPDLKLMVECYKGRLVANDAINYKKSLLRDKGYNPAFNIITDLRETEMQIKAEEDLNELKGFLDFLKDTPVKRRVALLVDKPYQTALATLFKELGSLTIIEYEVFSTLGAAINYIGFTINEYDLINEALLKLSRDTSV